MAVLVREDVRLGERAAARAELRLELVEEAEIDVDVAVLRAVEGAHCAGRDAAPGLDLSVEEARPRRLVVPQRLRPVRLDAVDDADDSAVLPFVCVSAGAALRGQLGIGRSRPDRLACERPQIPEPAALAREHEVDNEDDDADQASAATEDLPSAQPTEATALASIVLDLRGVEAGALAESHARPRLAGLLGRPELLDALRHLVLGHVLDVRCDPPEVPALVTNACRPVAVELIRRLPLRRGSRSDRPVVRRVAVLDIEMDHPRHRGVLGAGATDHYERVADHDLGVPDGPVGLLHAELLLGPERLLRELQHLRRILVHEVRRDGAVSVRYRLDTHGTAPFAVA